MVRRETDPKSSSMNRFETWTADTQQELEAELERECGRYHPMGYGTSLNQVTYDPDTRSFTGSFYRRMSCD